MGMANPGAVVDLPDADMMWVWAIQTQITLLYDNDGQWIADARTGWGDDSFHRFLSSYSLLRGEVAQAFGRNNGSDEAKSQAGFNNRKIFINLCATHYAHVPDGEDWVQLDNRWSTVRSELKKLCKTHDDGAVDNMPSATLKAFWFYQPTRVPMFDGLTKEGLRRWLRANRRKEVVSHENFLQLFAEFYNEHVTSIACAQQQFIRPYPFRPRIADKYLWLLGNSEKDTILARFRVGIQERMRWALG